MFPIPNEEMLLHKPNQEVKKFSCHMLCFHVTKATSKMAAL